MEKNDLFLKSEIDGVVRVTEYKAVRASEFFKTAEERINELDKKLATLETHLLSLQAFMNDLSIKIDDLKKA